MHCPSVELQREISVYWDVFLLLKSNSCIFDFVPLYRESQIQVRKPGSISIFSVKTCAVHQRVGAGDKISVSVFIFF